MRELDLSIVIIHYRMVDDLLRCLASIYDRKWDVAFEVLIIHKPSGDRSRQTIVESYPAVRIVETCRFGIASMRNLGIAGASGRILCTLDADVEVLPGAFDRLVEFMDTHAGAAGAGPKTLRPDGSLEPSCRRFYTVRTLLARRTPLRPLIGGDRLERVHLMEDWDHGSVREVDWVAGACIVMSRDAVGAIGMFDESFVYGFEDVDWCYRARLSGRTVYYVPDASIIHHVQRRSARGLNWMTLQHLKSAFHFYHKHRRQRRW
ncbi:hypothetical protein AMJ71_06540 [candidate division TA06 bacterium SM1_40]|uniref:Glycosyltransferase 2-like domain-containing protein n=2 Tax=Bacteria division TA06 TaxID=1156500 RepID=A0A0S8JII1_UNCT6|nr:MAG: hypothetical protein AMJ82_01040 [candidate division TA06 bacterium SM23_40]KPL09402.1 MAG: hypothetical protein AMJ71_06540 [candidate division TA06 bacterium SM1_40]